MVVNSTMTLFQRKIPSHDAKQILNITKISNSQNSRSISSNNSLLTMIPRNGSMAVNSTMTLFQRKIPSHDAKQILNITKILNSQNSRSISSNNSLLTMIPEIWFNGGKFNYDTISKEDPLSSKFLI